MKSLSAPLCALGIALSLIGAAHANESPQQVATALAAIENAKAVATAGRGSLLIVGSILSSDENSRDNAVVVLDYPVVEDMKPGMVLILAKNGCEPIDQCLIARRVTEVSAKVGVETEPYGGAEGLLLTQIKATLLGSVSYAVDLATGDIRDLRVNRAREVITVHEAVAQEEARTRRADVDAPRAGG